MHNDWRLFSTEVSEALLPTERIDVFFNKSDFLLVRCNLDRNTDAIFNFAHLFFASNLLWRSSSRSIDLSGTIHTAAIAHATQAIIRAPISPRVVGYAIFNFVITYNRLVTIITKGSRMMKYLHQNIIVPFRTDRKSSVPSSGILFFSFDFAHVIRGTVAAINILRFRVEDTVHTNSALV